MADEGKSQAGSESNPAQTHHLKKNQDPALRKVLGVSDGIAILIGISIGAGIYSTPQIIAGYLGSFNAILLLWLLNQLAPNEAIEESRAAEEAAASPAAAAAADEDEI